MAPVILSVTMFSLLLLLMIDVVQCSTIAFEVHTYLNDVNPISKAIRHIEKLSKPDAYYIGSNKEHLIEQIRARISMTQPTIDKLAQLYKAKFGDITERLSYSKEFDPGDQVRARQLLYKLKDSHVWFGNVFRLFDYQDQLKDYYSKVEVSKKHLQEGYKMLSNSPKLAHKKDYLDMLQSFLNQIKKTLDKFKPIFGHELDILNAEEVDHNFEKKFDKDKMYSDYHSVKSHLYSITMQCENLNKKLDDELLMAESDNDESDVETPQDDVQLKKAKAELRNRRRFRKEKKVGFNDRLNEAHKKEDKEKIRDGLKQAWNYVQEAKLKVKEAKKNSAFISASNSSGSQENQENLKLTSPVIAIKVGTQSSQEDQRPFWKKKRYNIPASLGGLVIAGWLLDLQNKIPEMIGWGSKEDDPSTKVNPPNSTTTDTSTDATTHQVENFTVVIIVLVVLALLVVGFAVFLVRCKNGTSDLERGEASHKSQSASTKASTTKGTGASSTPTRSVSSNTKLTSDVKSKKTRNSGTASTSVSTKTKSKRSSQK